MVFLQLRSQGPAGPGAEADAAPAGDTLEVEGRGRNTPASPSSRPPASHQSLPLAEPNRKSAGKWTDWDRGGAPMAQGRVGERMDLEGDRRVAGTAREDLCKSFLLVRIRRTLK